MKDLEKGIYILIDRYEILSKLGYILSFFVILLLLTVSFMYIKNKFTINQILKDYNYNTQQYKLMIDQLNEQKKNNYINTNKYNCVKYKDGIVCKRKRFV